MDMPIEITKQQIAVLDSLQCERLSSNDENIKWLETFEVKRNPNLQDRIKNAWSQDHNNEKACYVVKAKTGEILSFFSLRIGQLFSPMPMNDVIETALLDALRTKLGNSTNEEDVQKLKIEINNIIDNLLSQPNMDRYVKYLNTVKVLDEDKKESNKSINYVEETYSAIEIVDFCNNDVTNNIWKSYEMPRNLGECVFWHIIVEKIIQIADVVACQYVYLFAADSSEEKTLVNYYKKALRFVVKKNIAFNKPYDDRKCVFMCANYNNLSTGRNAFYRTFNK